MASPGHPFSCDVCQAPRFDSVYSAGPHYLGKKHRFRYAMMPWTKDMVERAVCVQNLRHLTVPDVLHYFSTLGMISNVGLFPLAEAGSAKAPAKAPVPAKAVPDSTKAVPAVLDSAKAVPTPPKTTDPFEDHDKKPPPLRLKFVILFFKERKNVTSLLSMHPGLHRIDGVKVSVCKARAPAHKKIVKKIPEEVMATTVKLADRRKLKAPAAGNKDNKGAGVRQPSLAELITTVDDEVFGHDEVLLLLQYQHESGASLDEQLHSLVDFVRLQDSHHKTREMARTNLEKLYRERFPGCLRCWVSPFGSSASGLGFRGCDSDLLVQMETPNKLTERSKVQKTAKMFRSVDGAGVVIRQLHQASVPLVRIMDEKTKLFCDLTFTSRKGVLNSQFVRMCLDWNPKISPFLHLLHYVFKYYELTGLSGGDKGMISSYALTMLGLFYLQQLLPALLPPVKAFQDPMSDAEIAADTIGGWNCGFCRDPAKVRGYESRNDSQLSVMELFSGFFEYYERKFDRDSDVASLYLGRPVPKWWFEQRAEKELAEMGPYLDVVKAEVAKCKAEDEEEKEEEANEKGEDEDEVAKGEDANKDKPAAAKAPLTCKPVIIVQDPFELNRCVTKSFSTSQAVMLRYWDYYFKQISVLAEKIMQEEVTKSGSRDETEVTAAVVTAADWRSGLARLSRLFEVVQPAKKTTRNLFEVVQPTKKTTRKKRIKRSNSADAARATRLCLPCLLCKKEQMRQPQTFFSRMGMDSEADEGEKFFSFCKQLLAVLLGKVLLFELQAEKGASPGAALMAAVERTGENKEETRADGESDRSPATKMSKLDSEKQGGASSEEEGPTLLETAEGRVDGGEVAEREAKEEEEGDGLQDGSGDEKEEEQGEEVGGEEEEEEEEEDGKSREETASANQEAGDDPARGPETALTYDVFHPTWSSRDLRTRHLIKSLSGLDPERDFAEREAVISRHFVQQVGPKPARPLFRLKVGLTLQRNRTLDGASDKVILSLKLESPLTTKGSHVKELTFLRTFLRDMFQRTLNAGGDGQGKWLADKLGMKL